ncbi:MCE family protein [Nocardioides sp. Kera G14]|uniref:MCE family protein n=1 Tax=Nocardioides sp. Kera G14 TaxID=2884264 RepID=UPI001D11C44E|nr:MlaD family protein [Nocardioides sp. Kera G14]UDY22323.1 MCE family protein [Nocardioides sp. Kera G14]
MAGIRGIAIKFALFALVAIMLLVVLISTMHNGVEGGTNDYKAHFTDVSGLRVGDDVKVAGVRVGRVNGISVGGDGADAVVDFSLSDDQQILDNTSLVMRYQNLVGQRYLAMEQPAQHGVPLHDGATIPVTRTDPGFDLTTLLNGFRPLFEVLQPADVNKLATSLVQVLQGEGGTIEGLLQQTTKLTTFVADRDAVIGRVLTNLTPVLQNLSGHDTQLSSTIVSLKQLMQGLAQDRESIGNSIDGVSQLIGSTSGLLQETQKPLVDSVKQFRTVATMLAQTRDKIIAAVLGYRDAFGSLGRAGSYQNALNIYACAVKIKLGAAPAINPAGNNAKRSKVCQ